MEERGELDPETHEALKTLCAQGDELAASGRYEEAIAHYSDAWALIPEPKNDWNAATWVMAALVDSYYLGGYRQHALDALDYAMTCPGAIGNPFLHLRYGQVLFDTGDMDKAADELMRAYMGKGEDVFEREDPRYLDFLRTRAIL